MTKLKWISIEDKLPPINTDVLTMCGGELTLAYMDTRMSWNPSGCLSSNYDMTEVTLDGTVSKWAAIPEIV